MDSWGIYLHSPFCRYKCTYCDFDADVYADRLSKPYVQALCKEIRGVAPSHITREDSVDSVYFGGGTPSLFSEGDLQSLLSTLASVLPLRADREQTIETIPEVIDAPKAQALRSLGFNRVSIGAETFNEDHLKMLGRTHSANSIDEACRLLRRAGHDNLNLDLIIGLPEQSLDDWTHNLDRGFSLAPQHISMYILEVHEATKLGQWVHSGRVILPEDELVADMYRELQARSAAEGYVQYEISNFARPGFESRHNLKYWSDQPYFGFGSSAHSYNLRERWKNVATPGRFIETMEERGDAIEERWPIDPSSRMREALYLGLRMTRGVDLSEFESRFGINPSMLFAQPFEELVRDQLVEMCEDHVRLTPRGMLLSNEVFVHFV